jgi:hypothetical protein
MLKLAVVVVASVDGHRNKPVPIIARGFSLNPSKLLLL